MSNSPMVVAGAALLTALGVFVLTLSKDRDPPVADDGGATQARIDDLENTVRGLEGALANRRDRAKASDEVLARIERRITALESRPAAAPAAAPTEETPVVDDTEDEPAGDSDAAFRALMDKVMDGTASADEQTRFWKLARETDMAEQLIGDFEQKVKDAPKDIDAKMNLAQAYIAKLLSIPGGPEQGVWAMKAEAQWNDVVKLDENHWEANYSIGESWNWYPVQLGKTPDAIQQFEKVRKIQEGRGPEDKHVRTYLRLSQLYNRQNNKTKAREALTAGIQRHPGDEELKKALESMGEGE